MTLPKWLIAEGIFAEIWAGPPETRRQVLAERCGDDTELCAEILSLLEADEIVEDWTPPPETGLTAEPAFSLQSRCFDPYQLERMISRGGMGAV